MPAGAPVHVLIEVGGAEDELALETPGELHLNWLYREDDRDVTLDAVRALEFPAGRVHAFVHGEASTVRDVRKHLLVRPRPPARGALGLRATGSAPAPRKAGARTRRSGTASPSSTWRGLAQAAAAAGFARRASTPWRGPNRYASPNSTVQTTTIMPPVEASKW